MSIKLLWPSASNSKEGKASPHLNRSGSPRWWNSVCVCVCVCEWEREREYYFLKICYNSNSIQHMVYFMAKIIILWIILL